MLYCVPPPTAPYYWPSTPPGPGGGWKWVLSSWGSFAGNVLPPVCLSAGHAAGLFLWKPPAPRGELGFRHPNLLMGFARLASSEPGGQTLEWRSNFIIDITKNWCGNEVVIHWAGWMVTTWIVETWIVETWIVATWVQFSLQLVAYIWLWPKKCWCVNEVAGDVACQKRKYWVE